jgi:sugar/nucleoside kinase (ribokinase family)
MSILDCTVVGDIFMDLIIHVGRKWNQFDYGGTSYSDFAKMEFGGSGNVAVGLSLLGAKVSLVGKAGKDLFGGLYVENLERNKVIPQLFFDSRSPTGFVLVFVHDQKERSFLVFRGANDSLSVPEIEKTDKLIRRSRYLYFTGYSLISNPQRNTILHTIELSRKYNRRIVFDPGAHNIIRQEPKLFTRILDVCDIFTPNLDEAFAVTNVVNLEDAIDGLKHRAPLTALKCGQQGCILISGNDVTKIPAPKVKCVDPTGAGDAFAAGLIYGMVNKLSLQATGQLANWFASQVVKGNGPRNFPAKSRIRHFLEVTMKMGETVKGGQHEKSLTTKRAKKLDFFPN